MNFLPSDHDQNSTPGVKWIQEVLKPVVTEGAGQTFPFLVSTAFCKYNYWLFSGINHKLLQTGITPLFVTALWRCMVLLSVRFLATRCRIVSTERLTEERQSAAHRNKSGNEQL